MISKEEFKLYREFLAKALLEDIEPDRFSWLEKQESPDFWDFVNDIGVEIMCAESERYHKIVSEYNALLSGTSKDSEKLKSKIKTLGGVFDSCSLSLPVSPVSYNHVFKHFAIKLEKLNKNYKIFAENNLAIVGLSYMDPYLAKTFLDTIAAIQYNSVAKFRRVFLYTFWGKIWIFNLKDNTFSAKEISDIEMLSGRAIKMTEQYLAIRRTPPGRKTK